MPQTRLSHGALSFLAPPPGEAHLSDALGAGMVACPPAPVAASGAVDGHGRFAAWHSCVAITGYTFDLARNIHRGAKGFDPDQTFMASAFCLCLATRCGRVVECHLPHVQS